MKLSEIYTQVKAGHVSMAAQNLGACGYSPQGLKILHRVSGENIRLLWGLYDHNRRLHNARQQYRRAIRNARRDIAFWEAHRDGAVGEAAYWDAVKRLQTAQRAFK